MSFDARELLSEKERHMQNLMMLSNLIWENRIDRTLIDRWLDNFRNNNAKITALEILSKFIYFNEKEIMRLCEVAFQELLVEIARIYGETMAISLDSVKEKRLRRCRFFGLGHASESGHYLLYPFRQRNSLPQSLFPDKISDVDSAVDFIIFIDDIVASGEQACDFWGEKLENLSHSQNNLQFFYLVLLAYNKGIEKIETNTEFKVIPCQIFDDSYKAFCEKSCIFPDKEKREKAKKVSEKHGRKIWPRWPLGYLNFQGLVGFHHNIPDTTLPIIWGKNNWFPIFERYPRIGV